jgi:restriction system protein
VGALSGLPFLVIAALAARHQWRLPSAARVSEVQAAVAAMAWPAFAAALEKAFQRDGYEVRRDPAPGADFALERQGRTMFVSARRWKAARTGIETLRALQDAREAARAPDTPDALHIGLAELTDNARSFADENRIAVWRAAELAQALRQIPLGTTPASR